MTEIVKKNEDTPQKELSFEDFLKGLLFDFEALSPDSFKGLPLDIEDTPDAYLLHMETPGVSPEDVNIELKDNVVTIKVDTEKSTEKRQEGCIYKEQKAIKAVRRHSFADPIKDATAKMTDGILTVTLKKDKEKPSTTTIPVIK